MSLFLQPLLDTHTELIVDGFAGGGGASSGIEQALGRPVDVAMNHDAAAIAMHAANHPQTLHLQSDIFEVNPRRATGGRPVGFAWFSPDCTYHSKARGSKPIRSKSKKRRALAWVITYWAGTVKPRVIMLENVEEFAQWGPLIGAPDALRPCPRRRGKTFRRWVKSLRDLGYSVEWRELRACDYGAPTIRKRLYLIARCDGRPIVWPEPTHGDPDGEGVRSGRLKTWRTAAECIDWSIPMCSIFATKEEARAWGREHGQASPIRPLAENTDRRIARGVMRYVVNNPKPFLVNVAHCETSKNGAKRREKGEHSIDAPAKTIAASRDLAIVSPTIANVANSKTTGRGPNVWTSEEPARTVTSSNGFAVVAPIVAGVGGRAGQSPERPGDAPMQTVTAKADSVIVVPLLAPITHQGDRNTPPPTDPLPTITCANRGELAVGAPLLATNRNSRQPYSAIEEPTHTVVADGAAITIVAPCLVPRYGEREGQEPRARSIEDPLPTVVNDGNGASVVAASLTTFRTGATGGELTDPLPTVTANSSETSRPGGATPLGIVTAHLSTYHNGPGGEDRSVELDRPLHTQDTANRYGVVAVHFDTANNGWENRSGREVGEPSAAICAEGSKQAVVAASLMQNNEGGYTGDGRPMDAPAPTVCATGSTQSLLGISLVVQHGTGEGADPSEPLGTVLSGGNHHGLAAAHIQRDFGQSVGSALDAPLGTVTGDGGGKSAVVGTMIEARAKGYVGPLDNWAKVARFLQTYRPDGAPEIDTSRPVDVRVRTETYYIADIAMRMLQPKELYAAQGFRPGYVFDRGVDGKPLTKTEQVRMCGNSVSPPVAEALVRANVPEMIARPLPKSRKVRSEVAA